MDGRTNGRTTPPSSVSRIRRRHPRIEWKLLYEWGKHSNGAVSKDGSAGYPLSNLYDKKCQWPASHTKRRFGDRRRPTPFEFRFLQNAALSSCKFEVACLRLVLNIEFLPNSRHACQIAARVSPVAGAGLRARGGKEPVGPLCQHLNANFPVRSLSLSMCVAVVDSKLHRASHSHGNVSHVVVGEEYY